MTVIDASVAEQEISAWMRSFIKSRVLIKAIGIYPENALYPEEEKFVSRAVQARRAEFSAGRHCARKLLRDIGFPASAIPVGPKGEPVWNDAVVGSISHDSGIAIAVISPDREVRGLGIDLLDLGHELDDKAADLIADESEIREMEVLLGKSETNPAESEIIAPLLLLFSAKEAAVKALSPRLDYYLEFRELIAKACGNAIEVYFSREDVSVDVYWRVSHGMLFTISCPGARLNPDPEMVTGDASR